MRTALAAARRLTASRAPTHAPIATTAICNSVHALEQSLVGTYRVVDGLVVYDEGAAVSVGRLMGTSDRLGASPQRMAQVATVLLPILLILLASLVQRFAAQRDARNPLEIPAFDPNRIIRMLVGVAGLRPPPRHGGAGPCLSRGSLYTADLPGRDLRRGSLHTHAARRGHSKRTLRGATHHA